ncbi:hypothetical protein HZS_2665 [Henneguya salminicola]|nr:hypothetical protein HZS_2665 [Henneguya salminicola]
MFIPEFKMMACSHSKNKSIWKKTKSRIDSKFRKYSIDIFNSSEGRQSDMDFEVDSNNQKHIKAAPPRRLITELFTLSLTFMETFFDTYPLYIDSQVLLNTLVRIYFNEEEIDQQVLLIDTKLDKCFKSVN